MTETEALKARVDVLEMLVNQILDGVVIGQTTLRTRLAEKYGAKDRPSDGPPDKWPLPPPGTHMIGTMPWWQDPDTGNWIAGCPPPKERT